jgi:hypothetical protein
MMNEPKDFSPRFEFLRRSLKQTTAKTQICLKNLADRNKIFEGVMPMTEVVATTGSLQQQL